jgi:hypothetical protein
MPFRLRYFSLTIVPAGPGVNDDGSGAMATLELANYFHMSGLAKRTVQKIRYVGLTKIRMVDCGRDRIARVVLLCQLIKG